LEYNESGQTWFFSLCEQQGRVEVTQRLPTNFIQARAIRTTDRNKKRGKEMDGILALAVKNLIFADCS